MRMLPRLLVTLVGLFSVMMALRFWFDMTPVLAQFGVDPQGLVGRATVRADIGGMFMGMGFMALMAAWRENRAWATGMLVMVLSAITGRLLSVLLDGTAPAIWPPIGVEVVMIAILLFARSRWAKPG